ncbi:hypothetical protein [Embleya sp. NPDC005971]|uniref:hypothetical protein n=1 Tax=Embleya sp. NPDC005971 TaxID=3156724 RepID=UPI0034056DDB
MTDSQATFPLIIVFALVVFMLVRAGELRVWQVVVVSLFGFYLAQTTLAPSISALVASLAAVVFHAG